MDNDDNNKEEEEERMKGNKEAQKNEKGEMLQVMNCFWFWASLIILRFKTT